MAFLGREPTKSPLVTSDIPDNSITAAKIVADTIAAGDIGTNAVGADELANDAVDTNAIADDAVTADKLANSINTDIATGVAALPKAGGAMTGTITNFTSTGIDDNASGAVAITIDSDEKVGIGETSPDNKLHVKYGDVGIASNVNTGLTVEGSPNEVTEESGVNILSTQGGHIYFGDAASAVVGRIDYQHGDNTMRFYSAGAERMRIDSSGNVGINSTSPAVMLELKKDISGSMLNIDKLNQGNVQKTMITFKRDGTSVGYIDTTNSTTSFETSSDYRLKENVIVMSGSVDRLKLLKPVRFNFIIDPDATVVDGFLAHEVQSIVPEAIHGEKDAITEAVLYVEGDEIPEGKSIGDVKTAEEIDSQGIDQAKLVPLLVGALQESIAKIEALEARVLALEG